MRHLCAPAVVALVFVLAVGAVANVAAQGTPAADQVGAQQPEVGTGIPYVDAEEIARGVVTVAEVIDPFEEFDPSDPPEAGGRYVLVTVVFEATGDQPFEINSSDILVQDADGYLWQRASDPRVSEEIVVPELESQTMAPGSRVSGMIAYVVPEDVGLARVFYQPESGRLITLADLRDTPGPSVDTGVPYVDAEGIARGLVTVKEIEDPFEDYDPSDPPEEGGRYVLLTVAFETTGDQPFEIDPSDVLVQDTDGYLWQRTGIRRGEDIVIPDMESQTMAPGSRVSGVVGFEVREDVPLARVYYQPESGRLILLADL